METIQNESCNVIRFAIVFQAKTNSTSGHDTQLFLASKIRVKGVDGWFERITRAIDKPVHLDIIGPGDDALGLVITQPITETNPTTTNQTKTDIISPEQYYNLEGELEALTVFLQNDPVANYRITMEQTVHPKSKKMRKRKSPLTKRVGLTSFINVKEGHFPSELNERQARVLMGIEHPKLNARGKINTCWALDRLSREFGFEWEELVNQIHYIAQVKRRIKKLKSKLGNAVVDETLEDY